MRQDEVDGTAGRVVGVIEGVGEVGVGLLILLETVVPAIPSEVVLPFAGFSAARGDLDPVLAWLAATVGAVLGAHLLYAVGALVGVERVHELAGRRWFLLFGQNDLRRGQRFFDRHGGKVVLFARCVPFLRSVVSVPAGLARMPLGRFTLLTALGSGVWNALFVYAGYRLGADWERVERYVAPLSYAVVGLVLTCVAALVVRQLRARLSS